MITPEEAERLAYIKGDTERAALLAIAIDLQAELKETEDYASELETVLEAKE
jgi:hypothetical protein